MKDVASDASGHSIYLTDERWRHICDEHPEMDAYRDKVLDSLRLGRRFQDSVRPDVFLYYRDYADLPHGNTTIVVGRAFRRQGQRHSE
ncbi:MAG: hypothetical protein HYY01_02885 [Chloroflexi bacterium]|nr:hypothetical protein [candidate division NC10 bacterium]MBI2455558.1 hypothetical protein [candidate division NC10 bacterium]MBI2916914.1 hypothetical protein [Chloroflexota bacterium]